MLLTIEADVNLPGEWYGAVGVGCLAHKLPPQVLPLEIRQQHILSNFLKP
jgi:hypothetical protein